VTRLPLPTQTLYAEVLDQLRALAARPLVVLGSGAFVTKRVKGQTYYYFQHSLPGGRYRQEYVGKQSGTLEALVARLKKAGADFAADHEQLRRLAAQLRAGGAQTTDPAAGRVLRALADAGVFRLGGVLVGTHAFVALGNLLGVRWDDRSAQTQDVDIARAARTDVDIAVPMLSADPPKVLDGLQMGFLPVPSLDPKKPSTSFKVRGRALRVDLLTPGRGGDAKAVFVPRLNAAAQPLQYLDYLIDQPESAVVIEAGPVLVNVPSPSRFALHKLAVATLRPATFHARVEKDLRQATEVLGVLVEDRPGDVALAWEACERRGGRWLKTVRAGLSRLAKRTPDIWQGVRPLVGDR
jgi:hypothetical protein